MFKDIAGLILDGDGIFNSVEEAFDGLPESQGVWCLVSNPVQGLGLLEVKQEISIKELQEQDRKSLILFVLRFRPRIIRHYPQNPHRTESPETQVMEVAVSLLLNSSIPLASFEGKRDDMDLTSWGLRINSERERMEFVIFEDGEPSPEGNSIQLLAPSVDVLRTQRLLDTIIEHKRALGAFRRMQHEASGIFHGAGMSGIAGDLIRSFFGGRNP